MNIQCLLNNANITLNTSIQQILSQFLMLVQKLTYLTIIYLLMINLCSCFTPMCWAAVSITINYYIYTQESQNNCENFKQLYRIRTQTEVANYFCFDESNSMLMYIIKGSTDFELQNYIHIPYQKLENIEQPNQIKEGPH